jgi:RNA-directed DNA polymerase
MLLRPVFLVLRQEKVGLGRAVLRKVRDTLRVSQHLPMQVALASVNPLLRGWVNYFRVGHSSQAFHKVRYQVERKVRRFAAKKSQRKGFGWKRWSSAVVYTTWGLFGDYRLAHTGAKARADRTDS